MLESFPSSAQIENNAEMAAQLKQLKKISAVVDIARSEVAGNEFHTPDVSPAGPMLWVGRNDEKALQAFLAGDVSYVQKRAGAVVGHFWSNKKSCDVTTKKMDCKQDCHSGWKHVSTSDHGCCSSFFDCGGNRKTCARSVCKNNGNTQVSGHAKAGTWGAGCRCPDGSLHGVGDTLNNGRAYACWGGTLTDKRWNHSGWWSNKAVTCKGCREEHIGKSKHKKMAVWLKRDYGSCTSSPHNKVNRGWGDQFRMVLEGRKLTIERTDANRGWGMNLKIMCCDAKQPVKCYRTSHGSCGKGKAGLAVASPVHQVREAPRDHAATPAPTPGLTDKRSSPEECYAKCAADSSCGGFFIRIRDQACLLARPDCTRDNNSDWNYYAMTDCVMSGAQRPMTPAWTKGRRLEESASSEGELLASSEAELLASSEADLGDDDVFGFPDYENFVEDYENFVSEEEEESLVEMKRLSPSFVAEDKAEYEAVAEVSNLDLQDWARQDESDRFWESMPFYVLLSALLLCVMGFFGYRFWQHRNQSKDKKHSHVPQAEEQEEQEPMEEMVNLRVGEENSTH